MSALRTSAAATLLAGALAATPAAAQEVGRLTEGQQTARFEREEHQRRRPSWLELVEHYGHERVDRAIRVDNLIHQGRCREARDLANAEGDRNMALRARQLCPGNTGAVTPRGRRMRGGA